MTDDCAGNRQIQAPHTTLAIVRRAARHGDREDLIALLPDRIR